MIRLLARPAGAVLLVKLRSEAQALWPQLLALNEVDDGAQIAFYFEAVDAPTQAAIDALVAIHDPTPPPDPLLVDKQRLYDYMPVSGSPLSALITAYIADPTKPAEARATMAAVRSLIRVLWGERQP